MFSRTRLIRRKVLDLPAAISFSGTAAADATLPTTVRFVHSVEPEGKSKQNKKRGFSAKLGSGEEEVKALQQLAESQLQAISKYNAESGQPDFKGKREEVAVTMEGGKRVLNVGLGPVSSENSNLSAVRGGVRAAAKTMKKIKISSAEVEIPRIMTYSAGDNKASFYLGNEEGTKKESAVDDLPLHLSRWFEEANFKDFSKYSDPGAKLKSEPLIQNITFITNSPKSSSGNKGGKTPSVTSGIIGNATNTAKVLGNVRPEIGTPKFYSDFAEQLCKSSKGAVKMRYKLVGNQLEKKGHNLHWNVGKGSEFPPHLVVMEYVGAPASKHSTALVGKGVTFDTGGLHVKPYGYMEDMHLDMCGAAAVLGTMQAVSRLNLKTNIVGVLGLAENAIGKHAYRPSSILKSLKGSTVEILNTDAEGRLVLADCLTFIQDHASAVKKKPDTIIDLATLTGAVTRALGDDRAGLFANDQQLRRQLYAAGEETLEPLWPLPIGPEHVKAMKGDMSDLRNVEKGAGAGASTAAAFLQHFINDEIAWAHLDIAGTASGTGTNSAQKGGASGFGVALLTQYLKSKAQ